MRRLLFGLIAAIGFVAGAAIVVGIPLWRGRPVTVELPGGFEVAGRGSGLDGQLVLTHRRAETAEWWKMRTGGRSMNVSGQTVTVAGNESLIYATQVNVDFGSTDWHGIIWSGGATSRAPMTKPAGVMSTPLVPFSRVRMPWWYPLPVLWLIPAIWLTLAVRRGRRPAGLCPDCGYDLRASPERCPECGRAVTAPAGE